MNRPVLVQRLTTPRAALAAAVTLVLAVLVLALAAGNAAGQEAGEGGGPGITILQAALVAIGYYLSNSPWIVGNGGFFGLYRPLVGGFLVGVIMGSPSEGAMIGAAINVLYLGFIAAGSSIPADP